MASLNERMRQLRKEVGLGQVDIAEKLGVDPNTVSKWELGQQNPKDVYIYKLTQIYNVNVEYLLGETDKREHPLTDEETAEIVEAEEREILENAIKHFLDLSKESQDYVRLTIVAVWKKDRFEGKLQSQQTEQGEPEE